MYETTRRLLVYRLDRLELYEESIAFHYEHGRRTNSLHGLGVLFYW
jgi:hypothetical protein